MSIIAYGEGKRIRLTFCIDKKVGLRITESPLSNAQVVEDLGGQYRITATVVESLLLDQWLAGFEEHIKGIKEGTLNERRTGAWTSKPGLDRPTMRSMKLLCAKLNTPLSGKGAGYP